MFGSVDKAVEKDGKQTYEGTAEWKKSSRGWWFDKNGYTAE